MFPITTISKFLEKPQRCLNFLIGYNFLYFFKIYFSFLKKNCDSSIETCSNVFIKHIAAHNTALLPTERDMSGGAQEEVHECGEEGDV